MIIGVLAVAFDHQVINIRHGGFDLHAIDVHCLELQRAQRTIGIGHQHLVDLQRDLAPWLQVARNEFRTLVGGARRKTPHHSLNPRRADPVPMQCQLSDPVNSSAGSRLGSISADSVGCTTIQRNR
ncbi:MAG: hypothetical protein JO122_00255 [Acetobacteraceae bacterium]|nr:hypothetical protein [Acetobacteraceae bacterium]